MMFKLYWRDRRVIQVCRHWSRPCLGKHRHSPRSMSRSCAAIEQVLLSDLPHTANRGCSACRAQGPGPGPYTLGPLIKDPPPLMLSIFFGRFSSLCLLETVFDLRIESGMKNCARKSISQVCSTENCLCGIDLLISLWGCCSERKRYPSGIHRGTCFAPCK